MTQGTTEPRAPEQRITEQWASFKEARDAIEITPLRDLEKISGLKRPWLFPLSGWAAGFGPLIYLAGGRLPILQLVGPMVLAYGILALLLNRARATDYRRDIYKKYVHQKALEAEEAEE
jgi:hypothetical protein